MAGDEERGAGGERAAGLRGRRRTPSGSGRSGRSSRLSRSLLTVPPISPPFPAILSAEFIPKAISPIGMPIASLGFPARLPTRAAFIPGCIAAGFGRCGSSPGFGSAEDTNRRFRYLLAQGQTGLSVAFDLPTLMGYDSDHAMSAGRSGQVRRGNQFAGGHGGAVRPDSAGGVTTSMTINSPAAAIWAMYWWSRKAGRRLEEAFRHAAERHPKGIHRAEGIHLSAGTVDEAGDGYVRVRREHTPKFNSISISGYHIREAGSTAIQEVAFTCANASNMSNRRCARGMESMISRRGFRFSSTRTAISSRRSQSIARRGGSGMRADARAVRRAEQRSWVLRFHTQTAGCSLTAQQPDNNMVRTAVQALAAVLGGTQSLHTNSLDEAWALPTEAAATIALRTQQILAYETGVTNTADPFGGAYFVETLTDEIERGAWDYIRRIDALGGTVRGD